jgi:NDP-sugar pyrophosphorylase family protein
MQAVILAGGLATRMRPRTLTVPKFLLPVAGRPFGAWLLERLAGAGYDEAVLCISHLGELVRAEIGDGGRFGLRVCYAEDGPVLLGTAGALRQAAGNGLLASTFLVTYGDSYLPFDYAAPLRTLETHADADGVMSVYRNEGRWDTSNTEVRFDQAGDPWVSRYEKRAADDPAAAAFAYIDYGAIALRRDVIEKIPPATPTGLDRIQADLARTGRLRAEVAHARFFEIGSEAGLSALDRILSSGREPTREPEEN